MARYTPPSSVGTLIGLKTELDKIKTAIDDTLSRKSDTPNQMGTDLDMNSNQILNLPVPNSPTSPVRVQDIPNYVSQSQGSVYVGETAPAGFNGMRWYNPTIPRTYIYYEDGTSGQWVEESSESTDGGIREDLKLLNSTVQIAGVQSRYIARKHKAFVTVEDYSDLVVGTDWTLAFQAALNSGAKRVEVESSAEYVLTAPLSIPDFVVLDFKKSTVSKQHSGNLVSFLGKRAEVLNGVFLGNGVDYAGNGVVVDQGGAANFNDLGLQNISNCVFINFRGYSVDYPVGGKGTFSKVDNCVFLPLPVSSGGGGVAIRWPNDFPSNNNGNRHVTRCYSADTLLVIGNTQNGFIEKNTVGVPDSKASIVFVGEPLKLVIQGNRFAHAGNLLTIRGIEHTIGNNVIASEVAFDPNCVDVHFASDNTFFGFNGFVPFSTNSIETDKEIQYTPVWTSSGTAPSLGNADVRASYSVRGRIVRGTVQITFGSTSTFGTGQYSFSLPLIPATYTKKYASAAWVQGFPCVAWVDPINAKVQIYQSNGTVITGVSPASLANGSTILFEFQYEMG